ncbi:TonB-dependent receptor plug domain-containing protein [Thermosulfuriphilus sp.]
MQRTWLFSILLILALLLASPSLAGKDICSPSGQEEIACQELLFLDVAEVATGYIQERSLAPATVTVISREEIRNMGARNLLDVLRTIPDLEVSLDSIGLPVITMRGINSFGSKSVKFLVNGHSVNSPIIAGGTFFFSDLSVEGIERVEIIRGPGSALYGSDAFVGVVNIILSSPGAPTVSYRRGTFDSDEVFASGSRRIGSTKLWGSFTYRDSNGASLLIPKDYLSDDPVNQSVSQAPGRSQEWFRRWELYGGVRRGPFKFEGQYLDHADGGYYNFSGAVTKTNSTRPTRKLLWGRLRYEDHLGPFEARLGLYASHLWYKHFLDYYPPGVTIKGTTYPYGWRRERRAQIKELGLEGRLTSRLGGHRLTLGLEANSSELTNVRTRSNYCLTYNFPYLRDVPYPWIEKADRFYSSLYIQEEWSPAYWVRLTLGGRYDHYDDFGDDTSFRGGLVINPTPKTFIKLLYGHGFRAPSFCELYLRSCVESPRTGNPNLEAEHMVAYELAIEYLLKRDWSVAATFFRQDYDDLIMVNPQTTFFENMGQARTVGVELEGRFRWGLGRFNYLKVNYSYQDSRYKNDDPLVGVARELGTIILNWRPQPKINFNLTCNYVGKRAGTDLGAYWLTDFTIRFLRPSWEASLSVHNLFDKSYRYPDPNGRFPDDFLRPGRTIDFRISWTF